MKNETLLFTFQQMLHPPLQNADTLPGRAFLAVLSSLHLVSTNCHLSSHIASSTTTREEDERPRCRGGGAPSASWPSALERMRRRRGPAATLVAPSGQHGGARGGDGPARRSRMR
jgi:hypothetical protein